MLVLLLQLIHAICKIRPALILMKKVYFIILVMVFFCINTSARQLVPERPRILISTDIGGTDPDDNQSMFHFLLYCNEFDCEGSFFTFF